MIDRYRKIRKHTENICAPLAIEDHSTQVAIHASPATWQLGHTTWFFEEFVLSRSVHEYERFNPDCAFLFNSYYNNVGPRTDRHRRGKIPFSVEQVLAYRAAVDHRMEELLQNDLSEQLRSVIEIGLNHEQQHQELLITDLKLMLSQKRPDGIYKPNGSLVNTYNSSNGQAVIPEGIYEIGFSEDGFCYDNELARHKVYLHTYEIDRTLATNREYMDFMEDGGYTDFNLWLDEGWAWVQREKISSPLYWKQIDGEWHQFTLGGNQKVDPDAILCHVSFYEAAAFAEWKGKRLPTEFEWEVAADRIEHGSRWEWTNSAYLPYPGYEKQEGALGEYNGKFMINQMVLRGSSVATSPSHSRKTYRNFFHPHYQWQFSGIRLARTLQRFL